MLMTDGPFAEGKEHIGGFTIIKAAGSRRRARVGPQGSRGPIRARPPDRGAAVPGRQPRADRRHAGPAPCRRRSNASSARSTAARWPSWSAVFGDIDVAEEAVQDAFTAAVRAVAGDRAAAEPGRLDHHHRPQPGDRPPPPRGVPRRPARPGRAAARPRRAGRGGSRARRPAAADLHLLPPRARDRRPGRADAAPARRPHDGGDRPRVPGARADHGAAAGPGQGQDPRRADPVPRPGRGRPAGPAAGRARRRLPHLQRGLHGELRRAAASARTCAPRRSASAGCWPSSCPTSRRCWACSRSCCSSSRAGPARTTPDGDLVPLADQDRGRWDRRLIAEGQALVRACLRRNRPGPYQIQAAINAVHSDAPPRPPPTGGRSCSCTTSCWRSPRARSWRSTARSRSPRSTDRRAALALVDALDLDGYHLFHAIRADLLRRLGRNAEAARAYEAAIARADNATERRFLERRLEGLN